MYSVANSITSLSLEEIEKLQDQLFAVHVTSELPVAQKIIAENINLLKNVTTRGINQAPLTSPILNWCLGRAIPEFNFVENTENQNNILEDSSYDYKGFQKVKNECNELLHEILNDNLIDLNIQKSCTEIYNDESVPKHAIVTKLNNLFPQLINIHFKHSMTLGDYLLTKKDYVLIPQNSDPSPWKATNIIYYNPTEISLNKAVIEFIKSQNGIIITEELEFFSNPKFNLHKYILEIGNNLKVDKEKIYYLREKDPFIFANIIQKLAISFGTDEEIVTGWILSYIEGIQAKIISFIIDLITSNEVEFGYTIEYLEIIEYSAKCIKESLSSLINNSTRFTNEIKEQFNLQQNNFYKWLKVYEIEKYLHFKYNKTLMGSNKLYVNYLINNIDQPTKELAIYIDDNYQEFKQCIAIKVGGEYCLEKYYLEKIYFLGISFFRKISLTDFLKIPFFLNNPGHIILYIISHIKNYEIFEASKMDSERMLKLLDLACIQLKEKNNQQHQIYVYNILMTTIKHIITINSYTDEQIIYGGKEVIDFLVNKSQHFYNLLRSQSQNFNENYKLLTRSQDAYHYKFIENLTLYNYKKSLTYTINKIPTITTSVKKLTPKYQFF